jgi:hypothetical protein
MPRIGYASADEYELEQALLGVLKTLGDVPPNWAPDRKTLLNIARFRIANEGIVEKGVYDEEIPF